MKQDILSKTILLTAIAFATMILGTGCDDWLDVQGENTEKEEDQFTTYKGFRDALTGCYMQMASESIYGQRMTMTDLEGMAAQWYISAGHENQNPEAWQLHYHLWTQDKALDVMEDIYSNLYNTIAQANVIIKHCREEGERVITSTAYRQCVGGEAYGIRAYCHLDVLRLFGQLPAGAAETLGGSKTVRLPYSKVTGVGDVARYYGYEEFCNLIEADIDSALLLLKDNDPVCQYGFDALNYIQGSSAGSGDLLDDNYWYYRQSRMNYYAVLALKCRFLLYVNRKDEAHALALEIINATNPDGTAVRTLSGSADLAAGFFGCPGECFFYLSKYDLLTSANAYLVGGNSTQLRVNHYYLTNQMLTVLYASVQTTTGSHNRYNKIWNRTVRDQSGNAHAALKKYWYDETDDNVMRYAMTRAQIIPMLRLSEIYLIAIETSATPEEANEYYATYEAGCDVLLPRTYQNMDLIRAEVLNEYRREFIGEGQMFFQYKRRGTEIMMNNANRMTEDDYIVPLPSTEYE